MSLALACVVFLCLDVWAVQNPALPDKGTANLMIIGGVFAIALAAGYVGWVFPRRAGTSFVVLAVLLVILATNLGPFEVPSLQAWQSWSSLGLFILSLFGSVTVLREPPGASEHAANSSLKT